MQKHPGQTSEGVRKRAASSSLFNLEGTGPEESGDIAQLGERLPCKQEVAGSIPTISTNP